MYKGAYWCNYSSLSAVSMCKAVVLKVGPEDPQQSLRLDKALTLSLRETPATMWRKPISAACTHDLFLSVMTHRS